MLFNWDAIFKKSTVQKLGVCLAVLVCLILTLPQSGFSIDVLKTLRFEDRWPDASVGNLDYNAGRNELYFASGNFLAVLGPDLSQISRIRVDAARGITGIAADPEDGRPYVYAACGPQGIAVINVSTGQVVATLADADGSDTEEDPVHASAVSYNRDTRRLYVADVYYGLRCFDMATPSALDATSQIWRYAQHSSYDDSISGGHINVVYKTVGARKLAFVLDQYYGLRIFDVDTDTAPDNPLASFDMRSRFYWGQYSEVVDVAVAGSSRHAFVSDLTYGVTILDFSGALSDSTPEISNVGQIETPGTASGLELSDDNNTLFAADGNSGMLTTDVSDPEAALNDSDTNSLDFPAGLVQSQAYSATGAYAVFAGSGNIYLASGADGLARLDAGYTRTGSYDPPSDTTSLYADAGYAYILDNDGAAEGLRIVNLAGEETGHAELTGFVSTPGSASAVAVHDAFAYVADGGQGVAEIDISDKASPIRDFTPLNSAGDARDIKIWSGDGSATAYIADSSLGLVIADIADTGQLNEIERYNVTCSAVDIYESTVNGEIRRYAVITAGSNLTVVNVTDPAAPFEAGTYGSLTDARDVAVTSLYGSRYAVVADGSAGIRLIDISDPGSISQTAIFDTEGTAVAVSLYEAYIHAALGTRGVAVIGISDTEPVSLTPIDTDADDTVNPYYTTPGNASDLFISKRGNKRYTYVADDYGGFLSLVHDDVLSSGINEQPFTESPDDTNKIECFISSLF
ncbi:MAG: hypothetical protein K9K81_10970 [Desulfobacteraceae bacterium]|nr:hypothetical protein [Desulfobacteraceae bacterium]